MQKWKRTWCLVAALVLWAGAQPRLFALVFNLEGLDRFESTNWTAGSGWSTVNLQDWRELDFIPVRAEITGGPGTNQLLNIVFPHYVGGVYGFQNLYFISNSPNVSFSAPPKLNADPASEDWSYDVRVTITNAQKGYVYFYARLAAGAHLNPGSSLHLEGPDLTPLQIHKPRPGPGSPDLAIAKLGPATAGPGDIITYTITYTNKASGTNNAAHGVQIMDNLPALVTFVNASGGGTMAGNTLSFDIPDLTNRASGFVTYQVRVSASATTGQTFTNNALIVSSEDDANMGDNRSSVKTTVLNRPPVANPDTYSVNEDTTLNIAAPGVLANDSDPDGNTITASLVNTTTNGTLMLNANGSFTYTPQTNFNGVDHFTYRATDGTDFSGTVSVTITVNAVNDAPVARNDNYSVQSDATLNVGVPGVLTNDSDVENDPLSAVLASNPTHGTVTLNSDGSFVYVPATNFSGSDTFTYRASDGAATSGVATVTITVQPNSIVVIVPPVNQTNCPGGTAFFRVTATGTALTYQWLHGTNVLVGQTNSTLVLTNVGLTDAGPYCVVVNGTMGGPLTNCATLVVNQNVFVVTPPVGQTNCPNTTATFGVNATGTALSYQWYFGAAILSNQTSSTLVLNNVTAANAGTYTIVVSGACGTPVTNSATLTVNQNVAITSSPVNQTSFISSNVVFSVGATGTGLRIQWFFNGAVVSTNSTLTLTNLTMNQAGTYCVVVTGTCGSPLTNCATLTIQNRAPVARDDSYTVLEDSTLTIAAPGVLANDFDPDGNSLRSILLSNVTHGVLTLNSNGSFVYTPTADFNGTDSFLYRARDASLFSSAAVARITVTPVNDPPSFTPGADLCVNENSPAQTFTNWATNISPGPPNESSQAVTFIVTNDHPELFAAQPAIAANGALTFTPATNVFGVANVHVVARDNGGTANGGVDTSSEVVFKITVNSPPTVSIVSPPDGSGLLYPTTFSVVASASDPDGTVTNVLFLVNGAAFTNIAQEPFYFVMTNVAPGFYTFRAIATDNCGLSATSAVVTIEVITNAVVATGPIVLNHQNGLFEQFATISNRTSQTWLNGVRLFVYNVGSSNTVYNATGTNSSGVPYIDNLAPVPAGGSVAIIVQYYLPSRVVPNPTLVAVPNPFPAGLLRIEQPLSLTKNAFSVEFFSRTGCIYFVQRTTDLVHWTAVSGPLIGTGQRMTWKDNAPQGSRFYRVLCLP